ncbi:glutamine-tRNA ligase [Gloeopeniophorella convolvens]|nr:glutamine-tRNA ligase [Gloeopeniophorella convolvens]
MAPPKGAPPLSPETSADIELFKSIGLPQAKAAEAAKSARSAAALRELIAQHELAGRIDERQAVLVAALAVQAQRIGDDARGYVVGAIIDERLKSTDQVSAAAKYLEANPPPVDDAAFDRECGVGFSISPEGIARTVTEYVQSAAVSGWNNMGAAIAALRTSPELRWANPLEVKNAVEAALTARFGAKEAAKPKGKEPKEPKAAKAPEAAEAEASTGADARSVFAEGFLGRLHKPGGNPQLRPALRDAHLRATGGRVYTRFPPEPNGFLHIGHSKAIFVNFGYAAHHGGRCYLRYDDTNPEAEEAVYFESILEMVRWLGYEPWKITYSSDYFDQLYGLAVELVRRDKAYVCHCTGEEIHAHRGGDDGGARTACAHRTRPVEESLREFENMKTGKYQPGEAILRMKEDLDDPNPQMWDLIAYRVLLAPHHRTGDKWKIYPTYDFTHCLVDSFENISHSLCTVEFIASRQSYEWLCDALEVYKPRQSEYGRLALQGTITSKRKLLALVREGYVLGWDDPRLYTLIALRRRGVPAGAILSFVGGLGVSTAASNIQLARFDQSVRSYLENTAPRLLMVLKPLKVTLENVPEDYVIFVEKALHPKAPALGTAKLPFTRTVYIDRDDFRLEDSPDTSASRPARLTAQRQGAKKPKAFIQWVAEHAPSGSPVRVDETRVFHRLFRSDNPLAAQPDYKADVDPDSLETVRGALVEAGFWALAKRAYADAKREGAARTARALEENETGGRGAGDDTPAVTSAQLVGFECVRFQGLRVAYFALDNKDARVACLDEAEDVEAGRRQGDYLVLNRIVSLKEDSGKAA